MTAGDLLPLFDFTTVHNPPTMLGLRSCPAQSGPIPQTIDD
ncbi:MAG TPA: hypothetical protein VEL49_11010 [Ktedonobacteraceae bacterium]|nr:hypothetical protein [Ktedonobacteraceae bacterium]